MHYLWDVWCVYLMSLSRCIAIRCQTCCPLCWAATKMAKYRLVLLRHGEGAWTKENRFCSWVDQKLSSDGIKEAQNCGKHLKALGFEFDLVFTSVLSRSIQTAWLILEEMGQEWVPIQSSWRLNERHYGALIGLNRAEMALNHGEEQVKIWRRSYDVTPPPISESHPYYAEIYNDRRYKCSDVSQENLPKAESLKDVLDRLLPYWNEKIVPELKSGKMILISAHGNSSRALLKHVEGKDLHFSLPLSSLLSGLELYILFCSVYCLPGQGKNVCGLQGGSRKLVKEANWEMWKGERIG